MSNDESKIRLGVLAKPPRSLLVYIARYGGICRDCADNAGICPHKGLPCADDEGVRHVLSAIGYGLAYGYINPETWEADSSD